ncbi:putative non-specific serine/threonine protein kinase [Helianthus annuus]|nr:putative non-specific serine/threonine protein kinase [Helianthus annuus]
MKILNTEKMNPIGKKSWVRHWVQANKLEKIRRSEIQPTFRLEVAGNQCIANFDKRWTDMPLLDSPASRPNASANLFQGFTYVKTAASFLRRNNPGEEEAAGGR